MRKILIIDDDIYIGNVMEEMLVKEGCLISRAFSGTEAVLLLEKERPDLILLDLMLPGLNGEEVLPKIKGIPVIVVSAKADVDSKVELLLSGAVDYVTKPFHQKELLARITVALRNASGSGKPAVWQFGDLSLDLDKRRVSAKGQEVRLTRTEYAILKLLMHHPSRVITKSHILECIGEDTPDCTENSLKTHMSHLRAKLRETGGKEYIEAVWGIGFKMKETEISTKS